MATTATAEDAPGSGRVTDKETGERWYEYPPTGELLDSVTTVISATNSKPWIAGWHGRTSAAWCVDNMEEITRVRARARQTAFEQGATTEEADKIARKAAIDLGAEAAERLRSIKRDAGTYVHDLQEALIYWAASPGRSGADIDFPSLPDHLRNVLYDGEPLAEVVDFMITGFTNWVSHFSPVFEATEMQVYNQPLGIAGTLDDIFVLTGYGIHPDGDRLIPCPGNRLYVCGDTKTGREPEGTWKEQLAAYRRMTECRPSRLDGLMPMPATDCAAVLHLRPEYPDGYLLMLVSAGEDEAAWARFLSMTKGFRDRQSVKNKPGRAVRPLRPDGTMPGPRLCDLAGEGYGRALAPLRKALGAATELEELASFTAAEVLAVKGVGPKLIETIRIMLADHGLTLATAGQAVA